MEGSSRLLIREKFPIVGREGRGILGPRIDPSVWEYLWDPADVQK